MFLRMLPDVGIPESETEREPAVCATPLLQGRSKIAAL